MIKILNFILFVDYDFFQSSKEEKQGEYESNPKKKKKKERAAQGTTVGALLAAAPHFRASRLAHQVNISLLGLLVTLSRVNEPLLDLTARKEDKKTRSRVRRGEGRWREDVTLRV